MQRMVVVLLAIMLSVSAAISAGFAQAQSSTEPPAVTPAPGITPTPEEFEAEAKRKAEQHRAITRKAAKLRQRIKLYRKNTWYWQDVMQVARKHKPAVAKSSRHDVPKLQWLVRIWKNRARHAKYHVHHPPYLRSWLCIHRHEGPWNSSTNPVYDGGLQMDYTFQRMYGARWLRLKGRAYNWTMWEQIWTAVRAWRKRWFGPWPNTRKPCGV
jgi:FAD/FMN-containing dehydrogenase